MIIEKGLDARCDHAPLGAFPFLRVFARAGAISLLVIRLKRWMVRPRMSGRLVDMHRIWRIRW